MDLGEFIRSMAPGLRPQGQPPEFAPRVQALAGQMMRTWPARLVQAGYQIARMPGDVYQGKMQPRNDI